MNQSEIESALNQVKYWPEDKQKKLCEWIGEETTKMRVAKKRATAAHCISDILCNFLNETSKEFEIVIQDLEGAPDTIYVNAATYDEDNDILYLRKGWRKK